VKSVGTVALLVILTIFTFFPYYPDATVFPRFSSRQLKMFMGVNAETPARKEMLTGMDKMSRPTRFGAQQRVCTGLRRAHDLVVASDW
jgi:hypothetical protein